MEAIGRVYCPIAWPPPGHDPGADCGVALLPGSGPMWPWDILDRRRDLRSRRRIAVAAVESGSSGRDDSCRTEQSPLGRASERFVSERLQRGER